MFRDRPAMTAHPPTDPLAVLGFDAHFAAALAALGDGELAPARVIAEHRDRWRVATATGAVDAEPAGRLRADPAAAWPAVGDWVAVRGAGTHAVVHGVLARRTALARKAAGRAAREQVLAANVDTVLIVTSCDADFSPRRLERYLATVFAGGALPVIVLNKADLVEDPAELEREAAAVAPGVDVHAVCAERAGGLDALASYQRPGSTLCLLGSSGVGKSTILNALAGDALQAVGAVREEDAKGRHTTRSRELFALPSGALLIDTPGLRELALWSGDGGVEQAFADVEELAAGCKFHDCKHAEEPGCAVRAAVGEGLLEQARFESYRALVRELEYLERKADPRLEAEQRRRWKSVFKSYRNAQRRGWLGDK
jgi:ribosome biogenesis GTPase